MSRSTWKWRQIIVGVMVVALLISTLRFLNLGAHEVQERQEKPLSIVHREKLHHINRTLEFLRFELSQLETRLLPERTRHPEPMLPPAAPAYPHMSAESPVPKASQPRKSSRALIFTMDCIQSYEDNSKVGGAAGELIIRHSLEHALRHFNVSYSIIRSDREFAAANMAQYSIILLDPWTWAAKGWVPKRNLIGHEHKIYILDFFGAKKLRGSGMNVPPSRFLTAFPTQWNTFLGFYLPSERLKLVAQNEKERLNQGVIWGKDPKHLEMSSQLLRTVAGHVHLLSTSSSVGSLPPHRNITWTGHLDPNSWLQLLARSRFLLGLGNPLLGPSAVDAVSLGCMFINPIYDKPVLEVGYKSQHPYVASVLPTHVCEYQQGNARDALRCVKKALEGDFPATIPSDLTEQKYLERVRRILDL